MFQTKVVPKVKGSFMFNNFTSWKSCRLWDNVEKYCRPGQVIDDNMAHIFWILDNWGPRHKLRICNIDCFFHGKCSWANTSQSLITRTFTLLLSNKPNTLKNISQNSLKKSYICHIPGLIKYLGFRDKQLFAISHCLRQSLFHGLRNAVTV